MQYRWIGRVIALLLCLGPLTSQAETSIWKVSRGGDYLYIGGTIHILSKTDYPLPQAFNRAYNDASTVVLEADLAAAQKTDFQRKLLLQTTYSGDGSVVQDLSSDTIRQLRAYLQERSIPPASLFRLKPGLLSITLTILELQQLGFTEAGVDAHFLGRAQNDGKALDYLESIDGQIQFLVNMAKGHEDQLIQHTIMELQELPQYMSALREGWRRGDLEQLKAVGMDTWIDQFPDLYDAVLVDRNRNWIPKIEQMLKTEDIELVLFGALHLVGEEGVLAMLEARGYDIEQLN